MSCSLMLREHQGKELPVRCDSSGFFPWKNKEKILKIPACERGLMDDISSEQTWKCSLMIPGMEICLWQLGRGNGGCRTLGISCSWDIGRGGNSTGTGLVLTQGRERRKRRKRGKGVKGEKGEEREKGGKEGEGEGKEKENEKEKGKEK